SDVVVQFKILRSLGVDVNFNRREHRAEINAKNVNTYKLSKDDVSKTRGSILFLGALIGRKGKAEIWTPGGDKIGKRPIDSYLLSLEKLGAIIEMKEEGYVVDAKNLQGDTIWQGEKAVTGTENLIMASVLAKGQTQIINAASEPHVQDLCKFLVSMGAIIDGIGTDTLNIIGVDRLSGCEFKIGFDFMEAATFIVAAAITGGELIINEIDSFQMGMILNEFEKFNIKFDVKPQSIRVLANQKLKIRDYFDGTMNKLECLPWPGFPPDVLQFATILATQSQGRILIHDKMYEGRLYYTSELTKMGADLFVADPHRLVVFGKTELKGKILKSPDIRAGMSLLLAALAAKGESIIERGEIIERGYEDIEGKFRKLGANIKRIKP
ncbi:MAG TPA: UDP-N-acetylglucosamine 1-carboxyvinyltransferase, partial [Candidatus Dojkabacteria bacterium]